MPSVFTDRHPHVRNYGDFGVPASYDTPHKVAERLAYHALTGMYPYQSAQYMNFYAGDQRQVEALMRLSVEDINAAARRYLDPENLVITVVGAAETILEHASEEDRRLFE